MKKYAKKKFLPCLVSEIQLFVYIFGQNSKWPPEVQKASHVKFFVVSCYQKFFKHVEIFEVLLVIEQILLLLTTLLEDLVNFNTRILVIEKVLLFLLLFWKI